MGSSALILTLLSLFHLIVSGDASELNLWYYNCSDYYGNYTLNSSYKSNLDSILTNISTFEVPYGFYNQTAGEDTDESCAIALCRGDINVTECHDCLNLLISNLTGLCHFQMDAVGWAEKCMLRYSADPSILGIWSDDYCSNLVSGVRVSSDADHFDSVVYDLLSILPNKTASGDSRLKFATGEAQVSPSNNIYAMMQCTPDLTSDDCLGCLYAAMYYALHNDRGQPGARVFYTSCSIRYESYKFYEVQSGSIVLPSAPPHRSGKERSTKFKIMIIVVVGVLACFSLLVNFLVCCCLKPRVVHRKMLSNLDDLEEASQIKSLEMDFRTIRDTTNNFSADNLVGSGGFGAVYKGTLNSGERIAVKRLASSSRQSDEEFVNEVHLAAKLQHRNLVKLLGFCLEGEERLLIFEFISNKSLDFYLFDEEKRAQLNWGARQIIIEGIARGLLYLHEDSRYKIVHRDLKPANILLDEDLRPKISDFGTARLFQPEVTHAITERAAGTKAYMAPEYFREGLFSVKSDVYSFGVMVLEIVAGRRNIIPTPTPTESLINLAWRNWSNGTISNIVDPKIASADSLAQVTRCIHIAFLCLQESPESRPTISSVNKMFVSQSIDLPYPSQLAFVHDETKLPLDADALLKLNSLQSLGSSTQLYPR